MSERLTKRDENGNAYYDWGCLNRNHWALGRHVDRLAAYEDTGLTPERIRELQNAFNILFESERQKQQENEQLRAQVARMREALKQAGKAIYDLRYTLNYFKNKSGLKPYDNMTQAQEALAEIDKAIGGKEDV